jgi:ribosomal protein S30
MEWAKPPLLGFIHFTLNPQAIEVPPNGKGPQIQTRNTHPPPQTLPLLPPGCRVLGLPLGSGIPNCGCNVNQSMKWLSVPVSVPVLVGRVRNQRRYEPPKHAENMQIVRKILRRARFKIWFPYGSGGSNPLTGISFKTSTSRRRTPRIRKRSRSTYHPRIRLWGRNE